ncbi:hypothetical protein FB107DRAFT_273671 [Schizophyllum commune]
MRKALDALASPSNGTETERLNDLLDTASEQFNASSCSPQVVNGLQVFGKLGLSMPCKGINIFSSWPNVIAIGFLNDSLDIVSFDALQVHQCVLGCARFGGGRAANASALANASMPRKSINDTASSPNAAVIGQLNDLSGIVSQTERRLKSSQQVAMRSLH